MATQDEDIRAVEAAHLLQVYRRVPIVLTHGKGSYVYDSEGQGYLDFLSGLGVASLGHAHPGLATALAEQARTLLHTSNLYFHPLQGQVAHRLTALSGLPRVFFCNMFRCSPGLVVGSKDKIVELIAGVAAGVGNLG